MGRIVTNDGTDEANFYIRFKGIERYHEYDSLDKMAKEWKDKDNKLRIDSLSVEMTCLRKEIEVFPFLINIGKYQLCASGKHNLVGDCGYHVELLKNPIMAKVGVDVKGSLKNPKITLGEIRYADLYKPQKQGIVEKRALEMKRMVREALEKNVR